MSESKIAQRWIKEGYKLFAVVGPKDFKFEKLASLMEMNKSGFYHYFLKREFFFEELLIYHVQHMEKFSKDISHLKDFMPGYLELLLKYNTSVQFQMQLRRNFNEPELKDHYNIVSNRNIVYLIPLFDRYLNLSDLILAKELFEITSDLMVTKFISDKLTFDSLVGIFEHIKQIVEKLRVNEYSGKFHFQNTKFMTGVE